MKRVPAVCLACLMLPLTACGFQAEMAPAQLPAPAQAASLQRVTQPPEAPVAQPLPQRIPLEGLTLTPSDWALDPGAFPTHLTGDSAELAGLFVSGRPGMALLSQAGGASLYGVWDADGREGIVLQAEGRWAAYDLNWSTPRLFLPQLCQGDYDGDGDGEFAILTYTGSGTGFSIWTLSIAEISGSSWSLRVLSDFTYYDAFSPWLSCAYQNSAPSAVIHFGGDTVVEDLSWLDPPPGPGLQLEAYTGTIVEYAVSGSDITVTTDVGVWEEEHIPFTVLYPAQITARIVYDGSGFALADYQLIPWTE